MNKKIFTLYERYAIWKTIGPLCPWCKTPVEFSDCQIDHIIPEKLIDDEKTRIKVLKEYGLKKTFKINSFRNWIPVHPSCNLTKQGKVIEGAPIFLQLLTRIKEKETETKELAQKWRIQNRTAKITALIERELEKGTIDKQTVTQLFAGINDSLDPITGITGSSIDNQVFYSPTSEAWKIEDTKDHFYILSKDGQRGITPINPASDTKWLCSNCLRYGPWDGIKCLSCGKSSID